MTLRSQLQSVSVVIPTRNRLALLQEAIESVRRQTYSHWELIVVDDCSEDDTWAWLSSLGDPRIRAVRLERHSERSAARNRGLAEARGEYVLFLDDDDLLTPRALERLMEAARRHPDAVGVAGAAVQFDGRGHRRRVSWVKRRWQGRVWPVVLWGRWILPGQAAIRRDELVQIGGWGERLTAGEDQELWLRLGLRGPAVLLPNVVLKNRVHMTWRGADTAEVESRIRQVFLERLPATEASLARRVLASREAFGRAATAYAENRFREAFTWWTRSLREAPDVTLSAPLRETLLGVGVRIILGLVLGSRGVDLLRRAWPRGRERLRRAPHGQVQVSGSALRPSDHRIGD
ncbi:MAG: glycosyltransferase family 2 protein [Armatimonadota bacterium]|nr:glycosyltransferase family 2 protein [Armatimonadota bacterium]